VARSGWLYRAAQQRCSTVAATKSKQSARERAKVMNAGKRLPSPALEAIEDRVLLVRGQKVMLDADLAALYGVSTKRLNEQARRNLERFPADFMFQLTNQEFAILRSQFATSSSPTRRLAWGGRRTAPYAFTEHGAIMAPRCSTRRARSGERLRGARFVRLREMIAANKSWRRSSKSWSGGSTPTTRRLAKSCA
jgi:hypothetical protein